MEVVVEMIVLRFVSGREEVRAEGAVAFLPGKLSCVKDGEEVDAAELRLNTGRGGMGMRFADPDSDGFDDAAGRERPGE